MKNTSFLLDYVLNNNPRVNYNEIESYEELSDHDLMIRYKNGNKEIFDTFANTCRRVVEQSKKLNEKQTRLIFRRKLQSFMDRAWVNQDELASRINSSQQMVSRYLTGESIPNFITLKNIAEALGCKVDDFYEDKY